jgi:hypothetical protein
MPRLSQARKQVQEFDWNDIREDEPPAPAYLRWLTKNISLDDIEFHDTTGEYEIGNGYLSICHIFSKYGFDGAPDIVISERCTPPLLQVGIDVRKTPTERDTWQATMKLLSASQVSDTPTAFLITDLRQHWEFMWLLPGIIMNCKVGLDDGVVLLEEMARPYISPDPDPNTVNSDAPFMQRCSTTQEAVSGGYGWRKH